LYPPRLGQLHLFQCRQLRARSFLSPPTSNSWLETWLPLKAVSTVVFRGPLLCVLHLSQLLIYKFHVRITLRHFAVDAGLAGVDGVFINTAGSVDRSALTINALKAVKRAGVNHVVVISFSNAGWQGRPDKFTLPSILHSWSFCAQTPRLRFLAAKRLRSKWKLRLPAGRLTRFFASHCSSTISGATLHQSRARARFTPHRLQKPGMSKATVPRASHSLMPLALASRLLFQWRRDLHG
jgi:hypothetical protein